MRRFLLVAALTMPVLTACHQPMVLPVAFPDSPLILNGVYTGQTVMNEFTPSSEPVGATFMATFVNDTRYDLTGTLTFRGVTYDVQGRVDAQGGFVFRRQAVNPAMNARATLSLGGVPKGGLSLDVRWQPEPDAGQHERWDLFGGLSLDSEQIGGLVGLRRRP